MQETLEGNAAMSGFIYLITVSANFVFVYNVSSVASVTNCTRIPYRFDVASLYAYQTVLNVWFPSPTQSCSMLDLCE
jgi:hypothetical protein